jgi:ribosomal protein L32
MTDRSSDIEALAKDCERYAKVIEGIIVVDDETCTNERREPRTTLLKAATALRASLQPSSPTAGECSTCGGRKEVGGFDPHEVSYRTEPCPECTPASDAVAGDAKALAEELREYTAMKYAGDCKCGKCHLVPREFIDRLYAALRSDAAGGAKQSTVNECPSCKQMFVDGETCSRGGCPMGGDF